MSYFITDDIAIYSGDSVDSDNSDEKSEIEFKDINFVFKGNKNNMINILL